MRKHRKKVAAFVACLLVLQVAACGKTEEPAADTVTETVEVTVPAEVEESVEEVLEAEETAAEDPNAVKWSEYYAENSIQEEIMRVKTGIFDRELTPEDLQTVTELEVDSEYLNEIGWLSYLTGLKVLKMPGGSPFSIENLDALSGLSGLEELDLSGYNYRFEDISALSGLTNLKTLSLSCKGEADMSPLSDLKNLTSLTLEEFSAEELDALSGLTNLTSLTIEFPSGNGEGELDLSPLSGLTNLETLVLGGGGTYTINDLGFLSDMEKLTVLRLGTESGGVGIGMLDISGVSELQNLETLGLEFAIGNEMWESEGFSIFDRAYDIGPLSALTNLKELKLGYTGAYIDLSALSGLTNLEFLEVGYISNLIDEESKEMVHYGGDFSSLSGLSNLRTLTMSGDFNQIASVPALPNLTTLVVTEFNGGVAGEEMRRLEKYGVLYLSPGWDTEPLPNLSNLTTLVIKECDHISEWEPFHLTNLTTLILEDGDDIDLISEARNWPFDGTRREWPNLTTLSMKNGYSSTGGQITEWDADWNAECPNLEDLTLIGFQGGLENLSGLENLTTLTLNKFRGEMNRPAGLEHVTTLTFLERSGYKEVDLTNLTGLTTLVVEQEGGNYSDAFSYGAVSGLPNLRTVIGVPGDIEKITDLPALETISFPYELFSATPNADISVLYGREDLTIRYLEEDTTQLFEDNVLSDAAGE